MGLASEPDAPFPHEPTESDELLQALRRHRVLARHGDAFDPLNYDGQRGASSIGDLIVIELLGRFVAEIERDLAPELPSAALAGLREIENVRPLLAAPQWLAGLLARTCPAPAVRLRVKQLWDVLADAVLDHPFLQNGQVCRPHNLVDGLARGLKFGRAATTGWGKETYRWLAEIRGVDSASYRQHALAEDDFRNRRARHIVYGHTHRAEEVPLESSHADGYVLNQMYFNAGTLRRVHAPTLSGPGEPDFVARDALSLVTFYHGDERRGRPYETWSGTLGVNPNELLTTPRVDAGANVRNATATPITPPVMLPIRAPHFDAAVQRDAFAARST
jgi:hypothetical protein